MRTRSWVLIALSIAAVAWRFTGMAPDSVGFGPIDYPVAPLVIRWVLVALIIGYSSDEALFRYRVGKAVERESEAALRLELTRVANEYDEGIADAARRAPYGDMDQLADVTDPVAWKRRWIASTYATIATAVAAHKANQARLARREFIGFIPLALATLALIMLLA